MKTTNHCRKIALLALAVAMFTAASTRADTYSWTNFQSDIPGVAQHTDPNLVNPWGMAAGSTGIIWVSDNGTGVSTLYNQDGTAVPLVVAIPTAAGNTEGANPTGIVFNDDFYPSLLYQLRANLLPALKQKYSSFVNRFRVRGREGATVRLRGRVPAAKVSVGSNHG